jgi:hypothetical protein
MPRASSSADVSDSWRVGSIVDGDSMPLLDDSNVDVSIGISTTLPFAAAISLSLCPVSGVSECAGSLSKSFGRVSHTPTSELGHVVFRFTSRSLRLSRVSCVQLEGAGTAMISRGNCRNIAARVTLVKTGHTGGTTRDSPVVANRRRPIWAAPICPARIASGSKSLLHPRLRTVSPS